jgi:hypothetical protein
MSKMKRQKEKGEPVLQEYIDVFDTLVKDDQRKEKDIEWQKNNLEYDLRNTNWILEKVKVSGIYAQNLYAALCNNSFQKLEVLPILKEERWRCSWRYAGGIIADMRQEGDYINWYCSGISNEGDTSGFVSEGRVTDNIRTDLLKLGWKVIDDQS